MNKEGYKTAGRLIVLLSFFCAAFLFFFISKEIAAAVALTGLIVLIPKVRIPSFKSVTVPEWLLAAFASSILATSAGTFELHPHKAILVILAFLCVPCLAFTVDLLSDITANAVKAKDEAKVKKSAGDTSISIKEALILLAGSAAVITMMSTSSPLYPYNYWDDANIFFTMGRGIKHGLVLYRDIYEQKGPSIFFVHALAALISEKTFLGVWLVEIAENFFFSFFAWKIVKLHIRPSSFTIATVPVLLSILCFLSSFYFGDSSEELCLPFLAAILYMSLKYVKSGKDLPPLHAYLTGILTGFVFWLKYTMCGFILGLAVFILIDMIKQKRIKNLLATIGLLLCGLATYTAPLLIYFAANNAVKDLFMTYFYNNIFYYTSITDLSYLPFADVPVLGTLIRMFRQMAWDFGRITGGFILIFIAAASFAGYKKRSRMLFLSCFCGTALGIYIGSTVLYYYCHLLMVFTPLALIPISVLLSKADNYLKTKTNLSSVIISSCLVIVIIMNILTSANFFFLTTVTKEDLPQYKFAKIMEATPSPKILNYDVMDIGLYTFTGSIPANRFFCYLNIAGSMSELPQEQNRLISEGYFDYIVAMNPDYEWEHYEIVAYEHFQFLGIYKKLVADDFYLYARVDQA